MTMTPSSPTRGDRVPEEGEEYCIDDFAGLESWSDPTPRPSAMTLQEMNSAWVAAAKHQFSIRPKSPSHEERTKRRLEGERKGLVAALNAYANRNNIKPTELELLEAKERNLVAGFSLTYVHCNFLVKGLDGTPTLFFAEMYPNCTREEDVILCTPLKENDSGHCFGCNYREKTLRHPTSVGYLGGHEDVLFPYGELDSDDDTF